MIAYQREACPSASFPGNQKASKSESEVAQSCPTLCDPMDYTPPGSSIHGILQARILEWVAISFSKSISQSESEVAQSCLTLCDPMSSSLHQAPPSMGFSVYSNIYKLGLCWTRDRDASSLEEKL